MTTARRWMAAACLALAIASGLATIAAAASPSPSAAPASTLGTIEAWLDTDMVGPPDMPAGAQVEVGITFWDTRRHELTTVTGVYVRMQPATGKAAPSVATTQSDFPGHIVAALSVPEGGPGTIEIGTREQVCTEGGGCADTDFPVAFAGVGPPPDVPLSALLGATFYPFVGDLVSGRPFPVKVDVVPLGFYDFSSLDLTQGLVVTANHLAGPELASASLTQTGQLGTPFMGHLEIPEIGPFELTVAIPGENGAPNQEIAGSTIEVAVIEGGPRESAAPAASAGVTPSSPDPAAPSDTIPMFAWIVGIGALVVAIGLVLRRVLADL